MPLSSLSSSARRLAALALFPLIGGAALVAVTAPTAQAVDLTSPVVISEVYGGGGNSGATLKNDFIELYNAGTQPVDLSTWSVQYASTTGTFTQVTNLVGSIAPRSFYLVQEAAGTGGTTALPTPNAVGGIAMSGTGAKVALVKNQSPLACGTIPCSESALVVDFIGWGSANDYLGAAAPATSNSTSAQRTTSPFTNTGVNKNDFTVGAPTPTPGPIEPPPADPCIATPTPPECVPGTTTIQDIQGDGFVSKEKGNTVTGVAGIVTAVRATGSRGFWIQQPTPDTMRTTESSGLFVFTGSTPTVTVPAVGDSVLVSGQVSDFYPLASGETVATTASLSITEISPTFVRVVSSDNPLPAPVVISESTVPNLYAPVPASGNVESISPVDPTHSALEFWEAHEGMLVTVRDVRVVGPGQQQFREIYVTTKPHELETPRGGTYIKSYVNTPTGRLLIIPTSLQVPAANVGDMLRGDTTGPVDWSTFGGYMIAATTLGSYVDNHLSRTTAEPQATDQLAIATYNVENLAPANPQEKFDRLAAGIVDNLKSPDVIAVEEIQDNSGATDDGVVAADQTLTKLTDAIKAAHGPTYQWAQIDPVDDQDGGQPGGNIRSIFLYNSDRVSLAPGSPGDSTTAVTVSTAPDGTASLSSNPGRVDPTNTPAWGSSRKPLAAEFVFQGRKVIVVANHFNSKGGDQSADGRFQPPNRSSEEQRTEQAKALNAFVHKVLDVNPNANVVLAGDFNDYQFSGPIQTLTDNGATLSDLITTLPENERYTYIFNGVSQVLDHIFVTKPVTDVQYEVVHNNAEFADQASDHDPQVVRIRPTIRQGTLTLEPTAVFAGQSTAVRLVGWYPNRTFGVALDGTSVGTVTTDATGTAALTLPVTSTVSPGTHTVSATATTDGATASAILTVKTTTLGTVVLSPPKVKSGKQVKVEVFGWSAGLPVTILLDGTIPLGTISSEATGYAQLKVTIANGTSVGVHQIVVPAPDGRQVVATLEVSR